MISYLIQIINYVMIDLLESKDKVSEIVHTRSLNSAATRFFYNAFKTFNTTDRVQRKR